MLINLGTEEKPVYVEPVSVVSVRRFTLPQGKVATFIYIGGNDDYQVDAPLAEVVEKINAAKIEHERQEFWDKCCAATIQSDESRRCNEDEADYCARIAWLKLQKRNEMTRFKDS